MSGMSMKKPTSWQATWTSLRLCDLPELIQNTTYEHVFIALPLNRYDDAREVFGILSQLVSMSVWWPTCPTSPACR